MINLKELPINPGCYLYKNKDKKIIYIGKAKNLRKRIKSYFNKRDINSKTNLLVKEIDNVELIITDTETEALILENTLIKQYLPKYNIDLKDAKSYAYIQITKEEYPRITLLRKKIKNAKIFGPFVSAKQRDYVLQILKKTFKLRTCKKMPKKPCLRKHINICSSPCDNSISKKEYAIEVNKAEMVLKGKTRELITKLTEEMQKTSKENNFEKAIILRNQIDAIRNLEEHQKMERKKDYDEDIINFEIVKEKVYLILFNIYKGTLSRKYEFIFNYTPHFLEEFLLRYYENNIMPKKIIVPKKIDETIINFLSEKNKKKFKIVIPKQGINKELLILTKKNIELSFFKEDMKLEELKKVLHLQETPNIIECFDISHLSGKFTVGSMVRFTKAKADKSNYRKFKIKGDYGIDDVKSMEEVIRRRYTKLIEEKKILPNLIVLDGGKAQLNMGLKELEKLNLKIPIIGIAKKFEEIFVPGLNKGIQLNKDNEALLLLRQIRDEAHRFAITFNKLLRKKEIRKNEI